MRRPLKLQPYFLALLLTGAGIFSASARQNPHGEGAKADLGPFINSPQDPGVLGALKQLTFVGPRSGEGYFSHDGKKMVFQSERFEGNPFYQIYLMDLEKGNTELVSPGKGKTTCAWIHPTGNKVMFASTHLDKEVDKKTQEEFDTRKNPQKNKYSWSFDDQFEMFEMDLKTKKLKALTNAKGYDAEGAYSPDGKKIVFASNRSAYPENFKNAADADVMTEEDQKYFKMDSSYMMDIYIMNADGTNVKRLTNTRGYDGGPFFSADGKKVTWRRFTANGQTAEIYTMNVDGSEQRPVTKLKAMSWAPFFHPSGNYLIFTSNVLGFSNFELFIVDAKGEHDPVRISYLDGFDGLPVFTPDGKKLAWTRRNEKGDSQIYMADWDDQKAHELLGLKKSLKSLPAKLAKSEVNANALENVMAWVSYLASEEFGGRMTGSEQEKVYTKKIAESFKTLGLVPAEGKDFIVPFTFTSGVKLGAKNQLDFQIGKDKVALKAGEDFVPVSFSQTGDFAQAPVVFAGYGIVAPAGDNQPAYDSYKGLDAKGKWVLAFRDIPENITNERRIYLNIYSRPQHKALVAKNQGALGLILVNGPNAFSKKLMKLKYEGALSNTSLGMVSVADSIGDKLVAGSGKSLKQWQDANDKGEIANSELKEVLVKASIDLELQKSQGLNVIAKLPVAGAKTSVMVGAHGDHLGRGDVGNSLAKGDEAGLIHYGADDNASGVSAVMQMAQNISEMKKAGKLKAKQNLLFGIWSGEEIGLLGSSHYLESRAENKKSEKITSYLNMDMIGRLRTQLIVEGVASAKEWKGMIEGLVPQIEVPLSLKDDPYVPSDAMAFYMKQIPAIHFYTGAHTEYHTPKDKPETINYQGLMKVMDAVQKLTLKVAGQAAGLTYLKVEGSKKNLEGRSFRIYLGTIPDYTQEGAQGVKISGTSKDSPAEKAGLLPGDVIVELANNKVQNLYDYVYCLQGMKANQETSVKISRQGKLMELKIIPSVKE